MSIAIIPARGGSTRIPRKNIRPFHGKPIICYSIETAIAAGFDVVVVSTDDDEIARIAVDAGASVQWRSSELCKDEVGTQEVMKEILLGLGRSRKEIACCIYPCAPLLDVRSIDMAMDIFNWRDMDYVFSVSPTQSMKFVDAGQFYLGNVKSFIEERPLIQSRVALVITDTIDINTPEDWEKAEKMYESRK